MYSYKYNTLLETWNSQIGSFLFCEYSQIWFIYSKFSSPFTISLVAPYNKFSGSFTVSLRFIYSKFSGSFTVSLVAHLQEV